MEVKLMNDRDFITSLPNYEFEILDSEAEFRFTCSGCGDCCRNNKNVVIVEPLDMFRLAKHLGIYIEEAIEKYMELVWLTWGFPVFTLKTKQHLDSCVFLKNSRCSVYDGRPRACRLYPLNAGPDDEKPGAFINVIDVKRKHHLTGPARLASEWMDENFSLEEREFVQLDFKFIAEFARLGQGIDQGKEKSVNELMLYYRYIMFELSEAFLPQYIRNMAALKVNLQNI